MTSVPYLMTSHLDKRLALAVTGACAATAAVVYYVVNKRTEKLHLTVTETVEEKVCVAVRADSGRGCWWCAHFERGGGDAAW